MPKEMCFASPCNRYQPIDIVRDGLSQCTKEALDEVRVRYPDAILMDFDEAYKKHEDSYVEGAKEITEDEFWYFLEVLPPCSWQRQSDSESFYMSEFNIGDVTKHLVRIGERYYSFDDHVMKKHEDRVAKCFPLHQEEKPDA